MFSTSAHNVQLGESSSQLGWGAFYLWHSICDNHQADNLPHNLSHLHYVSEVNYVSDVCHATNIT